MSKLLDCIQICPARPAQRVVEWAIGAMSDWRDGVKHELQSRQNVFRELLEGVDGWEVATGGAYFAYVGAGIDLVRVTRSCLTSHDVQVKHPFEGVPSQKVSQYLAARVGIITLPGTFFSPPFDRIDEDRYIRFCAFPLLAGMSVAPRPLTNLFESNE